MEIYQILNKAEKIQKDMHNMMDDLRKDPKCANISYDSLKDIFFFMKIAELQNEIEQLKQEKIYQSQN